MRVAVAVIFALAAIVPLSLDAYAQGAGPAGTKDKAAPKSTMAVLCPKQSAGGEKVNVRCGQGEKCCYHPLFDNGSCGPQADACLGVVNPLPPVPR